jgi:hypothetical protein
MRIHHGCGNDKPNHACPPSAGGDSTDNTDEDRILFLGSVQCHIREIRVISGQIRSFFAVLCVLRG